MVNLKRASNELFRRTPDETFPSLSALTDYCLGQQEQSREIWQPPGTFSVEPSDGRGLLLRAGDDGAFSMNDWSFGQLCRLSGVAKETVNRLSPATASEVFRETLPQGKKPLQLFSDGAALRSIHAASYTRLYNSELLSVVAESATDFEPPQEGMNGATGLYAGEQDLFIFMIDPGGWVEIEGEAFAPGFFCWNSEVGSRSLGIQTFWFQACCKNHIVWDAVEVVDFSRKHTANVHESLTEVRRILQGLVEKRDARRDGFAKVIANAMTAKLGDDADEVRKVLSQQGISRTIAKEALRIAEKQGAFTVFSVVDALTRMSQELPYAGQRVDIDQKAASLLAIAA
jgi:hypothetical protein